MKKLLSILLVLLLALAPALAEEAPEDAAGEPLCLYLGQTRLVQRGNECLLHLILYKTGTLPYCLDVPEAVLYDAEGAVIPPEDVRLLTGLNPLPAGEAWCPITIRYLLPEGKQAADFRLLSLPGESFDEPCAQPFATHTGHILGTGTEGVFAHLWVQQPMTATVSTGLDAVLSVYDADGAYLASQWISSAQRTAVCTGEELLSALAEHTGMSETVLGYYGVNGDPGTVYDLYTNVPLTGLAEGDIPIKADVETFIAKQPLTVLRSDFAWQPDGRLRVNMAVMNSSCEPYRVDGGVELNVTDAEGNRRPYRVLWFTSYTYLAWEPFGLMMMTFDMEMFENDFEPESVSFTARGRNVEETGFCTEELPDDAFTLAQDETGAWFLSGCVPQETAGDTRCLGVMWHALDRVTGHYLTCSAMIESDMEHTPDGWRFGPVEIPGVPQGADPLVRVRVLIEE